jgi:hypothetical protein
MKVTVIKFYCIGTDISAERFIPNHFFLFLAQGTMHGYDGSMNCALKTKRILNCSQKHYGKIH